MFDEFDVFNKIGRAAMGTPGSAMVYATIYMTIFCEPIIFHITCMETLRQVSCCGWDANVLHNVLGFGGQGRL
jgi:hypothetical protein